MSENGRRILLAVRPHLLEGALAEVLAAGGPDEVVCYGGGRSDGGYDAAVVCIDLPEDIRPHVVITLADRRGSGGPGSVSSGGVVHEVLIDGPERVLDLLDEHVPRVPVDHR